MREKAHHKGRNTLQNYLNMLLLYLEVWKMRMIRQNHKLEENFVF